METELWHEWVQWEFLSFSSITITQNSTASRCCRSSKETAAGFFLRLSLSPCLQPACHCLCPQYYVIWLYFPSDTQSGIFVTLCLSSLGCLCKNDQLFKRALYFVDISPKSYFYYYFFNLFFNWTVIALRNFVVFCQSSTWISHRYTNILSKSY